MKKVKKQVKVLEYNALFTQEEEGGYSVIVPDLPGCISQGDTFEEAKQNIAEAIELYLEDADEELYHETAEDVRKQFFAPISGAELVRAFLRDGWVDVGQKGSHRKLIKYLKPVGKRRIIIPQHRVVKKGTLAAILRDAAVSADKLRELL